MEAEDEGKKERVIRSTPDWSETAINGEHLWVPTSISGDFCYVDEADCVKAGHRMKCSGCNIIAHQNCINILIDKVKYVCKPTFKDVDVRQYREKTSTQHHWVYRRTEKGKCRTCGKSFPSKTAFTPKKYVAVSCSWCKAGYHNKEHCFTPQRANEECKLGVHSNIIVPPSWIIKLPRKGGFRSSIRGSFKRVSAKKKKKENEEKTQQKYNFVIKPIPTIEVQPIIVFINPKSGGNQGIKLMQKFQWLLNPRQVFDLTQGGPRMGLELYKGVPNLKVLACGGDGTVGWVLSVIDQIGMFPPPAVGVLPLGTGNDLARALGWGGGYTDEPVSKILSTLSVSEIAYLDRWSIKVEKNPAIDVQQVKPGKENLPLNVLNNYFSLGVDAYIALEFHEAREAHPEKFNSRLRNKIYYGQMGGKDLLIRKWKDLSEYVTIECDGEDITYKLKEYKVHSVLFLNIPTYGGGTRPWNRSLGLTEPSTDDGIIEVVGLTTYQMPILQAGGHGTCLTQCRTAKIVTSKTIPMQVDGEACRLLPSIITLSILNQAPLLAKRKHGKIDPQQKSLANLELEVFLLNMSDYERYQDDQDHLNGAARSIGRIEVSPSSDLDQVRTLLNSQVDAVKTISECQSDWCFLDSCTAERFFRIDKAQEQLHYISDIAEGKLYILDCTSSKTFQDETAAPSPDPDNQTSSEVRQHIFHCPIKPESEIEGNQLNGMNGSNIFNDDDKATRDVLLNATKAGDLKMIKKLHQDRVSLNVRDQAGLTMLHYAARCGYYDIIKYLVCNTPAELMDVKDCDAGQTALHHAAGYHWKNACCILVASGAALNTINSEGLTAAQVAFKTNDQKLASYLKCQEQFEKALLKSKSPTTQVA